MRTSNNLNKLHLLFIYLPSAVSKTLQLDDWIAIDTPDIDGALSIKQLRLKFHALFQRRLKTPFSQLTQVLKV